MNTQIPVHGSSVLVLRVLTSGIFIIAGLSHLIYPQAVSQKIATSEYSNFALFFGDAYTLGLVSGYVLLLVGVSFLLGIFTRWSALILLLALIPITITIQMSDGPLHGPLWKNIALAGALMFFIISNPKSHCLYNP